MKKGNIEINKAGALLLTKRSETLRLAGADLFILPSDTFLRVTTQVNL